MAVRSIGSPVAYYLAGEDRNEALMPISDEHSEVEDFLIDLPSISVRDNLWMEEYLSQSTGRLDSITALADQGEKIDRDSRNWMLNQVDFIVESLGADTGDLDESVRSGLLQLILAIANLDQRMRRKVQFAVEEF
jgi:hypothetical protein